MTTVVPPERSPAVRPAESRLRRFSARAMPTRRPVRLPGALALLVALAGTSLVGGCENVSLGDITPTLEDDSPLAREVGNALAAAPELAGLFLKVKSLDGDTVRLSGNVDTDAQRHVAERTAVGVPGVRSVVNTLFVRD